MMTRWLFDSALAAGLVLLAGAAVIALVRQPARRQRIGEWTLIGCLVIALAQAVPALPRITLGWLPQSDPTPLKQPKGIEAFSAKQLHEGTKSATAAAAPNPVAAPAIARPAFDALAFAKLHWASLLLAAYALASGAAVVRLAFAQLKLRRLVRTARPAGGPLADLWRDLATRLPRRTRLLISPAIKRPICFGVLHPVVLVPATLAQSHSLDDLRIILLHELVHIRRRDAVTWLIAALAQIVFFYQPLYWHLRKQLRLAQEYIADAWAAEQAQSPVAYAENLLRLLKEDIRPVSAMASSAVSGPSEFYRRMQRLLSNTQPTDKRCGPLWTVAAGVFVLALALGVSTLTVEAARPRPLTPEQKGIAFLLTAQERTGGWLTEVGPAPTALVVKALLGSGLPATDPAVARAVAYLESHRQPDGGFYADTEPTYNTAIVLTTLALLPGHERDLERGQAFLAARQKAVAPARGGWYAPAASSAVSARNAPRWLDPSERSAEAVLASYGSLTYASVKSFVYAGLAKDDPRVKRSSAWVKASWTLEKNPGLDSPEGLYYYYHLLAKTLRAAGDPIIEDARGNRHDWRTELRQRLAFAQRPDGSWVNTGSGRWLEDRPELVTAYSVLALQETTR